MRFDLIIGIVVAALLLCAVIFQNNYLIISAACLILLRSVLFVRNLLKLKPFWWVRHARTTNEELSKEEIKRRERINLFIDIAFAGASAGLLLVALLLQNGFLVFPAWILLTLRSVFWSRHAGVELILYRQKYRNAIRADRFFSVSRKWVIKQTLRVSSIFYVFWFGTAFLIPLGGFYSWLYISIVSCVSGFVISKFISGYWQELGLSRIGFWGLQIAAFVIATLPGAIVALIKYD